MIHRTQIEPEFKLSNKISNKALRTLPRAVQWARQGGRRGGERGDVELDGKREALIITVIMPLIFLKLLLSTSAMLNTFTGTISFNVKKSKLFCRLCGSHMVPYFPFFFLTTL